MDDLHTVCSATDGPATEIPPAMDPSVQTRLRAEGRPPQEVEGLASIVEALLFASDTPLSAMRVASLVGEGVSPETIAKCIEFLNQRYARGGLSFRIEHIAGGFQMMTLPQYEPWLSRLNRQRRETRLSAAALETLAIIAYKQPIIRADIEAIRGVACSEVIQRLREMGLVRVVGRADVVGRPMLYGTTRKFLEVFGLSDLKDLPPLEQLDLRPRLDPVEEPDASRPTPPPAAPADEARAAAGA